MEDIAPKLYEKVKNEFQRRFEKSKKIKALRKKIEKGESTYKDAGAFAIETGEILSDVFLNHISSDTLPNGRLYYNIADRVVRPMIEEDYNLISDHAAEVQKILNRKAKIGIKSIKPELNQDKVQGIIDIVSGKDKFDDIAYMLRDPIINFSQTIVDDTVKTNADFQYKAGLSPEIIRISTGKCCKRCNELAGTYKYENVSDTGNEVFRRHERCRCIVEYDGKNGKIQNVHTKKERKARDVIMKEKDIKATSKLKSLAFSEAKKRGYDPLPSNKVVNILREKSVKWRDVLLRDEEKLAIEKYTFNGVDPDGKKLYEKINRYLTGQYIPMDQKEENMILNFSSDIQNAILKSKLDSDIIVYRRDYAVPFLQGQIEKFLSTSVTTKGTLGGNPNVAIIVPQGTDGAYIELLSRVPKQREFLLGRKVQLKEVLSKDGLVVFEVIKNEKL